jgi:very-short-patch-repair endonuclease
MRYAEALIGLDKIVNAQAIKASHDKQKDIIQSVKSLKTEKEQLFSDNKLKLALLSDQINTGKSNLDSTKQLLISSVENHLQTYSVQLDGIKKRLATLCHKLTTALEIEVGENTDFEDLKAKLEWAFPFQEIVIKYAIGNNFAEKICARNEETLQKLKEHVYTLDDWSKSTEPWLTKFTLLFVKSRQEQFPTLPLADLMVLVQRCHNSLQSLENWIDYHNAEIKFEELGINSYFTKVKELNLTAEKIVPVFEKCFFRSWLDAVIPKFPSIKSFRRERQEDCIRRFKNLDISHLEISKAALLARLIQRLPTLDSFSAGSGEIAFLRREMVKQRKLIPTRKLIAKLPDLLPVLKPCMMMSPLSVSTYLGNNGYEFDTVIFDEASQVRTEDAICSIFRAKQAIIAGDNKQLPPTDFFRTSISDSDEFDEDDNGEINDNGAFESLLDEATGLPTQTLLWHYRSKHEHLIAFSNAKIYQSNLITFPSSTEKTKGMGVEFIPIEGGIYERGGKNGNKKEAERIAELVFEHFHEYPKRSLGIIAFGEIQQTIIEEAIHRKRRENPQYERFFNENKEESIFIKNLETVQGDERDTIIFSIGYAPDASGKFIMNFGPLSRNGGERRLNVAITRARYNLKLVSSISPTDINIDRTSGQGPKLLRQYIDFAKNGTRAILGEAFIDSSRVCESPFEMSVYNFLTDNGYDVINQVGCSKYRIDLAVCHPEYNGRFAIGIECDGAMYHSTRTARERDRLRQTILEDMGWTIYRVWSTDWIKDQHTEGIRLLSAIKSAIDNYQEEPRQNFHKSLCKSSDFLDIITKSEQEIVHEKHDYIRSPYAGSNVTKIPMSDFEQTMLRVLENKFGLSKIELFKETAQYGYTWQRQGNIIQKKFEQAYCNLHKRGRITEQEGKVKVS